MTTKDRQGAWRTRRGRDWLVAVIVCVVIHVAYGLLQPRMTLQEGLAWDATHYYSLAQQFRDGAETIEGPRPFAFRIGAAWMAAHVPVDDLRDGFLVTNLAFCLQVLRRGPLL